MTSRRSSPSPFTVPTWAFRLARSFKQPITQDQARMQFVIELAATNVQKATGGPFGAAVFERRTGRLISIGVNVVESTKCSHAHAEMVALARAQHAVHTFDLGASDVPEHELVTSCEPCAMCYGAIPWSGVRRLLCGAHTSDAEAIGFDEGPKPKNWVAELTKREITVVRDVCRKEAVDVIQRYKAGGGAIYGNRRARK